MAVSDRCPNCRRPVAFLANEAGGRRIVVDPDPDPRGDVVAVGVEGGRTVARVLAHEFERYPWAFTPSLFDAVPDTPERWRRHLTTCDAVAV